MAAKKTKVVAKKKPAAANLCLITMGMKLFVVFDCYTLYVEMLFENSVSQLTNK